MFLARKAEVPHALVDLKGKDPSDRLDILKTHVKVSELYYFFL